MTSIILQLSLLVADNEALKIREKNECVLFCYHISHT